MQIRECRVTCIKLVWNTGTLYELGNFFQYMTRESQIYVNILYSLCRTCLNKLTTSSKFLLHVRLTCNYNNYLCSKMQCNSSVCVTCGLPKKKKRKALAFKSTERKKRQTIILSFREQRDDQGSDLKTECSMGLDKETMINEKPQIICNHRKIGL